MSSATRRGRRIATGIGALALASALVAGLLVVRAGRADGQGAGFFPQVMDLPCPQPSPGAGTAGGEPGRELLVAGGSEGLLLLAEDGTLLRTLSCAQPEEPIMAVAVRPGSTPDRLTIAMAVRNATKDVLVLTLEGDRQVVHSRTPAGVAAPEFPSLQWSPDGRALVAVTAVDAAEDTVTLAIDEHPLAEAGAPPPRACRVEGLSSLEGVIVELERWTDEPGTPEAPSGIGLRAEDGQGYTVDPACDTPPVVGADEVPGDARVLRPAPLHGGSPALVGTYEGGDPEELRLETVHGELPLPDDHALSPVGTYSLGLTALDDAVIIVGDAELAWRVGHDGAVSRLPRLVRTADRVD